MTTKAKLLCSSLLLSLIIMLPATVRAESAVLLHERANQLFEQIQDLELMQRNIEECYQAEKGTLRVASFAHQSRGEHAELDGKLINRVFGHLAGTPEYERFVKAHGALIQRPDYRRLHTDELFAEYMRPIGIRADTIFDSVEGMARKFSRKVFGSSSRRIGTVYSSEDGHV